MLDYVKQRTIKFSGVFTIMLSLIVWVVAYAAEFDSPVLVLRLLILTGAYLILALLSDDYRGIGEMFTRIWDIQQTEGINEDEKLNLIKNFLEAEVRKWDKYWKLYQSITNHKTIKDYPAIVRDKLKDYGFRIYKGEVNVVQATWIFAYLAYTLVISANIFHIPVPIDILVSVGIMFVILFASGSIVGFGQFMGEFFKAISGQNETQVKARLKLSENLIISGSKSYYFISIKKEQKLMKQQMEDINRLVTLKNKVRLNGD